MARHWLAFPHPDRRFAYDGAALGKHWARLHRGDAQPLPRDKDVLEAWRRFHAGDFGGAVEAGRAAGGPGMLAACKAQAIYADHLERNEKARLALFEEVVEWAQARRAEAPREANAHYLLAYALGRHGQGISVAKALAQGYGGRIREALTTVLELAASHAEAHTAYGAYQSEVIEKVGGLVAGMTYGAKKDSALGHFEQALALHPESAVARIEYANGLIRLFGKGRLADAEKLYRAAADCTPVDAMERLDVERARSELE